MRVLAIEDNDDKFERVAEIVKSELPDVSLARACDLFEAEREIERPGWDLLLLDMTLDLRRGGARRPGTAQDYVGGMKVVGKMYWDELAVPTIIITAFDSFPSPTKGGDGAVIGLESVHREAGEKLGDLLIGTVRHGPEGWEDELKQLLARVGETGS